MCLDVKNMTYIINLQGEIFMKFVQTCGIIMIISALTQTFDENSLVGAIIYALGVVLAMFGSDG